MPEALAESHPASKPAPVSLWAAGLYGIALLLIFHQTTWSMVSIWMRSETFAHGFIILPITLWLVWNKRRKFAAVSSPSAPLITLLLLPPGFVWLLAWLVDVLVVQQLALVAMLIVGSWAILGHHLARILAFPLLFLFFAVPMGQELVPPMMQLTATATVWLIELTGIPVYREGLYFSLPSGHWSVVAACSGVRYLIASVTLGVLYAYLTYHSLWRRALFVLASAIVPIVANILRAYLIVMVGHLSDMKVATGVDHLVYGWVFFGVVMLLLFWLGSFFVEEERERPASDLNPSGEKNRAGVMPARFLATTALAILLTAVWPQLASVVEARTANRAVDVKLPEVNGDWRSLPEVEWNWRPDSAVSGQAAAYYTRAGQTLGLYVQYADGTQPGAELVGSLDRFVTSGSGWHVTATDKVTLVIKDKPIAVDRARLRRGGQRILVWTWYRIGALHTSNKYVAKFAEAWTSLSATGPDSYRILLALPEPEQAGTEQAIVQDFLDEHLAALQQGLDRSSMVGAKQ